MCLGHPSVVAHLLHEFVLVSVASSSAVVGSCCGGCVVACAILFGLCFAAAVVCAMRTCLAEHVSMQVK